MYSHNYLKYDNRGQTLVTLLFFMVISLTITAGAIIVIVINTQSQTDEELSQESYYVAEAGMENALLRLDRNPAYTGETLTIDDGSATTAVVNAGNNTYYATSSGTVGNFTRKIQVKATYANSIFQVINWKEIF